MFGLGTRAKKAKAEAEATTTATATATVVTAATDRIATLEDKPKTTPTPVVCFSDIKQGMQIPNDWPEWLAVVVSSGIWPWAQDNLNVGESVLLRYERIKYRKEWEVPFVCASPFVFANLYIQRVMYGWNIWHNSKIVGMIRNDIAYGKDFKEGDTVAVMGTEAELNIVKKFSLK